MKVENVTIESDGTAQGTKVKVGKEYISGVTKIEIVPIHPGEFVMAKITVVKAKLDIHIPEVVINTVNVEDNHEPDEA